LASAKIKITNMGTVLMMEADNVSYRKGAKFFEFIGCQITSLSRKKIPIAPLKFGDDTTAGF
jgi:hypothetical protein